MEALPIVRRLIFPAPNPPAYDYDSFPDSTVWIPSPAPYSPVPAILIPYRDADALLVFAHGNGADIGSMYETLQYYKNHWRVNILLFEYPGYGACIGVPTEASINAALESVYKFIRDVLRFPNDRVILCGQSIGTGPVSQLTARLNSEGVQLGGTILLSPFTSLTAVIRNLAGVVASHLIKTVFNNAECVTRIHQPILIIHGVQDEICPFAHSQQLFDSCPSERKHLLVVNQATHNHFDHHPDIINPISQFLQCYLRTPVRVPTPAAAASSSSSAPAHPTPPPPALPFFVHHPPSSPMPPSTIKIEKKYFEVPPAVIDAFHARIEAARRAAESKAKTAERKAAVKGFFSGLGSKIASASSAIVRGSSARSARAPTAANANSDAVPPPVRNNVSVSSPPPVAHPVSPTSRAVSVGPASATASASSSSVVPSPSPSPSLAVPSSNIPPPSPQRPHSPATRISTHSVTASPSASVSASPSLSSSPRYEMEPGSTPTTQQDLMDELADLYMLSLLKNVADFVTPVLTESQFAGKGVLTPEEFVQAGDQLVFSCRTWQWAAGNPGTAKKYLPADKQFLITRNVPSLRRAHTYALADAKEEVVAGAGSADMDDGEGWLSTHSNQDMAKSREVHDIDDETNALAQQVKQTHLHAASSSSSFAAASSSSAAAPVAAAAAAPASAAEDDEIGDIDDMDADMASNLVAPPPTQSSANASAVARAAAETEDEFPDMQAFDDDDNVLPPPTQQQADPAAAKAKAESASYLTAQEPEDNIVKTRTYDISITYDKYYRTPRVYLFGYDEHRQPLTADQIMEDISSDHANKTVTVEAHPFLGVAHASIHPCKHAHVMKRIVDQMTSFQGSEGSSATAHTIDVKQYMYIFLKFISSVIPTVEYDFTM